MFSRTTYIWFGISGVIGFVLPMIITPLWLALGSSLILGALIGVWRGHVDGANVELRR
jgi:hypothetical protein